MASFQPAIHIAQATAYAGQMVRNHYRAQLACSSARTGHGTFGRHTRVVVLR
jgi:hypothetical protein